jgi:HK97 family phage major capsid protein
VPSIARRSPNAPPTWLPCWGPLPSYARNGAIWLASPEGAEIAIGRLARAAGGATVAEVQGAVVTRMFGFPVEVSDKMPTTTTSLSGLPMLAFGNFRQGVGFGARRDITLKVDESRYLEYDQVAIRGTERFDINVHDIGDGTTAGPIILLMGA